MKSSLKPWPNKLGFDYKDWELFKRYDGIWFATKKPNGYATHSGQGTTYIEAINNAKPIE